MPPKRKELKDTLGLGIRTLILQEVRLLRFERTFTPHFVIDAMSQSIQGTKREIIKLVRTMDDQERTIILKGMIRETVDDEIDRAIQVRKNRCLRCLHVRYYDEVGTPHMNLPIERGRAQIIGCDRLRPSLRKKCRRFVETTRTTSLEDYLSEMALLYKLREMFERFQEVWEDYFSK
jgi:hypothetical protein